jgi:hypothetical protein
MSPAVGARQAAPAAARRTPVVVEARLDGQVARKLGDLNVPDLASSLWAMATMGRPPTAELASSPRARGGAQAGRLQRSGPVQHAVAVGEDGQVAYCGAASSPRARGGVQAAVRNFNAQNLSNTLWAIAKMERPPTSELRARLELDLARKLGDFNAQEQSNTLWAMLTMGRLPTADLQARLELELARKVGDLNAQELANTFWSYATMRRAPTAELSGNVDIEVELKLGEFNALDIQQVLSSYSALEHARDGKPLRCSNAFAIWLLTATTRGEEDNPCTGPQP